jgi:hypothetical protein
MAKRIGIALVSVALAMAVFLVIRMGPRNLVGMLRYDSRRTGKLKVGDRAPDVELVGLDGGRRRLSESIGARPLVLVFGSYT